MLWRADCRKSKTSTPMNPHNRNSITFDELNQLYKSHLTHIESLESLELLAEIVASTTCDSTIACEILDRMEKQLEADASADKFFTHVDYASRLECEEFEKRF